jgi:hypothetical protein
MGKMDGWNRFLSSSTTIEASPRLPDGPTTVEIDPIQMTEADRRAKEGLQAVIEQRMAGVNEPPFHVNGVSEGLETIEYGGCEADRCRRMHYFFFDP